MVLCVNFPCHFEGALPLVVAYLDQDHTASFYGIKFAGKD